MMDIIVKIKYFTVRIKLRLQGIQSTCYTGFHYSSQCILGISSINGIQMRTHWNKERLALFMDGDFNLIYSRADLFSC